MARACKDNRIPAAEQAEQNRAYSFRLALACSGERYLSDTSVLA